MRDVLAGPILASEVGGRKCKIWGAIGSDLLAGGAGGARLAGPRIGSGPTWPRPEQEAPQWRARRSDATPVATLGSDRQTPRHTLGAIRFSVTERVRPTYKAGRGRRRRARSCAVTRVVVERGAARGVRRENEMECVTNAPVRSRRARASDGLQLPLDAACAKIGGQRSGVHSDAGPRYKNSPYFYAAGRGDLNLGAGTQPV